MTVGNFYKRAFQERLNIPVLIAIPVIVFGVFLVVGLAFVAYGKDAARSTTGDSFCLRLARFCLRSFRAPAAKNSGWRGYLRPELEARYGFMKGNLVLGLVWAFWHAPLWFVASDYAGSQAVIYIFANIIVLTP